MSLSDVTVVIPTNPIPLHPDTSILEETVASVRHWFPDSEIFLCFDGMGGQPYPREDYAEYTRRALWLADKEWGAVVPTIFGAWYHQSGMMLETLPEITTPLILYVEHDAPLVTDCPIDWKTVYGALYGGFSDLVRFHHEAVIPEPHQHMMHGEMPSGLMRTSQWSQRPHLATTAFYRRIMTSHFRPGQPEFIEDRMHSVCDTAFRQYGLMGWRQYRTHIYYPEGNIKRSYHLDGRKRET